MVISDFRLNRYVHLLPRDCLLGRLHLMRR
jgi:hypothetical protein